ncbi:MAG: Os1348 family NHLP clan protein [Candidatus Eisenbacteria bacterium]|nr:Os1348 family NHLP clan protein [Candidatus Eisenbacteria bacterium]
MHKHVEVLIGRLATDAALQVRFAKQPHEVVREQGLDLNAVEIDALIATGSDAFRAFSAALDARLRKATLTLEIES